MSLLVLHHSPIISGSVFFFSNLRLFLEDKILELSDGDKHVFISYSWNNQEMCIAIKDRLKVGQIA